MEAYTHGLSGKPGEVKSKQQKDSKNWPEFNNQDHILNLSYGYWPKDLQLNYVKVNTLKRKLNIKLIQKRYRTKHKAQRKKLSKEYYRNHKDQFKIYNIIRRQKFYKQTKKYNRIYMRKYRKKNRSKLRAYDRELYQKNKTKMKAQEIKEVKFIRVIGHKIPPGFTTIRLENLRRLQEAIVALEVSPLTIFYGEGKLINVLISGLKSKHQLFFFHRDRIVYFAIEHRILVNLKGRVIK